MQTQEILQFITKELGITYQERGRNFFFSCPFHTDKTPSLAFSKENKFFKCFSCDFKAKDIFTFWAKIKKVSLSETLEKFAKLGYLDNFQNYKFREDKETTREQIFKLAGEIYQHNLLTKEGNEQLNYLKKKRALSSQIIEQFMLGTSISSVQLSNLLFQSKLFSISELVESNLFQLNDQKDVSDFFWEKQIIFPINDQRGKLVFFASRNLNRERDGKYFFLPNNNKSLIKKSTLIYNYDKVKEINTDFCYLVEGFFDVISLVRMEFYNSLSILGTSISTEQLKLLKKLEKKIIIFFDGDQAGVEAAIKAAALLTLNDVDCEVIEQEGTSDPDELCLKGKEEINKIIKEKYNPIFFIVRYYFRKMQIEENPQKTRNFILKIANLFGQFRKNIQFFIIKKISIITGMTINEIEEIYFSDNKQKIEVKNFSHENDLNYLEEAVIYYSCVDRKFWSKITKNSVDFWVEKNQNLWKIIDDFYKKRPFAENFSEFKTQKEFLNLPFFDESEREKLKIINLFIEKKNLKNF